MDKQTMITAAQPISYMAPQWLVNVNGPPLNAESLEWLNEQDWQELKEENQFLGWPPYNAIVEAEGSWGIWQYIALVE